MTAPAPLTDELLAEWRTLTETVGDDWNGFADDDGEYAGRCAIYAAPWDDAGYRTRTVVEVESDCDCGCSPMSPAELDFVLAARQAVPALLAEVDRLREERREIESMLSIGTADGLSLVDSLRGLIAHYQRLSGIVAAVEKRVTELRSVIDANTKAWDGDTPDPAADYMAGARAALDAIGRALHPDPKPEAQSRDLLDLLGVPEDARREIEERERAAFARIRESERRAVTETRDVIIGAEPDPKPEPSTACARCGRDPALGVASITLDSRGIRLCHPDDPSEPDCYTLDSHEESLKAARAAEMHLNFRFLSETPKEGE